MTMTDLMREYGFLRPTEETPILNELISEQLRLEEQAANPPTVVVLSSGKVIGGKTLTQPPATPRPVRP